MLSNSAAPMPSLDIVPARKFSREDIRLADEAAKRGAASRRFEIERERPFAPVQYLE